ncbi:hypothetical protein PGT21_000743 [Puccinia graminis f. sp. tritici]|uniref:Uncharacterized protein n=1 Tax=Puccinia graminis f. sp. tritici TaxID=56615 RepID=A0A5B0MHS1_PUCGR|nr:hypothetical protein PGT21_000743 [Puccinia graminis f. sp. tritici]
MYHQRTQTNSNYHQQQQQPHPFQLAQQQHYHQALSSIPTHQHQHQQHPATASSNSNVSSISNTTSNNPQTNRHPPITHSCSIPQPATADPPSTRFHSTFHIPNPTPTKTPTPLNLNLTYQINSSNIHLTLTLTLTLIHTLILTLILITSQAGFRPRPFPSLTHHPQAQLPSKLRPPLKSSATSHPITIPTILIQLLIPSTNYRITTPTAVNLPRKKFQDLAGLEPHSNYQPSNSAQILYQLIQLKLTPPSKSTLIKPSNNQLPDSIDVSNVSIFVNVYKHSLKRILSPPFISLRSLESFHSQLSSNLQSSHHTLSACLSPIACTQAANSQRDYTQRSLEP